MMDTEHLKISFAPISDPKTAILILGSLPGDTSLALNEYYGHPRNRFWKIISTLSKQALPLNYTDKKALLQKTNIGVWDVAHTAIRKGSLDMAMAQEVPNDLEKFINSHNHLKVIGFNGKKAETLFDRHFNRKPGIRYVSLPSSSPANAAITFENICKMWEPLFAEVLPSKN